MFRFQSVVYGFMISFALAGIVTSAWTFAAEDTPAPVSTVAVDNTTRSERDLNRARSSCQAAKQQFSTDLTEVLAACANMPGGEDDTGGVDSCIRRITCCLDSNADDCPTSSSSVHASSIAQNKSLMEALLDQMANTQAGSPQMSQLEAQQAQLTALQDRTKLYQACPMRAAVDIDKAYEEAEKAREKLEQREDAINEIKEKITETQQKLEEDKLKIEKEMKELELKTQKDFKEIRDQSDDAQKRLLEDIEAQEQRKAELLGAISSQEQAKADAYQAMTQKFTELEVQCWQEGVKKAQDTRAKILEKAAQNKFSAGSLDSLYKSVGSSTLEDTQKLVDYHKRLCEKSLVYKKNRELAQVLYNRAVDSADKSIATIRQEVTKIELKISRMMTDDKAKIHKDTAEKIEMLSKAYEDGSTQLTKQYNTTVQAASQRIAQLQEQLAQKQAHLQAAQEHMQYKQALLDLRKKSNPGDANIGGDEWGKAIAAAQKIKLSAGDVQYACCDGSVVNQQAVTILEGAGLSPDQACASGSVGGLEKSLGTN